MNDSERARKFWLGNAVLAVALVLLLEMDRLWHALGVWAFALWAVVAGIGAYLLTVDKKTPPANPGG